MKTKKLFGTLLSVAAAVVLTACSNNSDDIVSEQSPVKGKTTIPYTVTVGNETRASVGDDQSTLTFDSSDKLYVYGGEFSGMLSLESGAGQATAVFKGTLSGEGTPADDLQMSAVLVSDSQQGWSSDDPTTINYNSALCATLDEAVKKYSLLTGTSTFADASFALTQQTAFLNCTITLKGAAAGRITMNVTNKAGAAYRPSVSVAQGMVTTTSGTNGAVATFTVPLAKGTNLSFGRVAVIGAAYKPSAFSATLSDGKVYNLSRELDEVETVQLWEDGPLFAKTNIGAISETDYPDVFAFGETWTKANYTSGNYTIGNQAVTTLTGGSNTIAGTQYDPAVVNWGSDWQMFNANSFYGNSSVTRERTTVNGVYGMLIKGQGDFADKSLFLPAYQYYNGNRVISDGVYHSGLQTANSTSSTFHWNGGNSGEPSMSFLKWAGAPIIPIKVH